LTELQQLWSYPAFQAAVGSLLRLPVGQLQHLAEAPDLTDVTPVDGVEADADWESALAALQTLYPLARAVGANEVVDELRSLTADLGDTGGSFETNLEILPSVLAERPFFERRNRFARVRTYALPQVTRSAVDLDFRAVESDALAMIPMVSMRLEFDEPVAGVNSLTVGLPPESLAALSEQITELLSRYEAAIEALGRLVPAEALFWASGNGGDESETGSSDA
jgi:hypothetical protein